MGKLTSLLLSTLLAWGLLSHSGLTQDKRETITGTKISIIPPEGFVESTRFTGYQEDNSNSSIVVTELPAPISQLQTGLTNSQELAKRGLILLEQQSVRVDDRDGILLKVKQSAYGTEFLKWILLLGNESESVLVTASFLQDSAPEYARELKDTLLTVQWNSATATNITEGLDYSVREFGELKLAKRISNSLIYTKNGDFPAQSDADPIFVASPSVAPASNDLKSFARNRLLQTENITEIEIKTSNKLTIDNSEAYEIIATGKDSKTGSIVSLYQVIILDRDNYYYIMQGQVDANLNSQYLPTFQQMARSFHRKAVSGASLAPLHITIPSFPVRL
jgi:hypothetical protein